MTAQHAPHTPPMWRRVLSLPHTRLGWWAIGLSGIAMVLAIISDTGDFQLEIFGMSVAWGERCLLPPSASR